MVLELHTLSRTFDKKRKRVGRGNASGHGSYSTRGQKGQRARSGGRRGLKRRGLKQFLHQLPKRRGFTSPYGKLATMNLGQLDQAFQNGDTVTHRLLISKGLIRASSRGVKVLGAGKFSKKLTVIADGFSESARSTITKAGGSAIVRRS
ncbi:MAG: 50S ribosomal protein L15 [Parcubacteria group bacterium]